MSTHPGIILQARVASRRLPGKALQPIGGRTLLEQCLRRLMASDCAEVVLATTDRAEDDTLAVIAERLGVAVFRGSEDDVLDRFVQCASAFELDPVIRATADNPCVDIKAPKRLLAALAATGADYVHEQGLPVGAAVEGVRATALALASLLTRELPDREHVTPFIKRRTDLFNVVTLRPPHRLVRADLRVTVDTWEDLQYVRGLYFRASSDMPTLADFIVASGGNCQSEVA